MKTKSRIQITIGLLFFLLCSCNCHDKGKPPCPDFADPGWLPEVIYWQPSWHPSGDFISFNYRPLKKIEYPMQDTCFAQYTFNDDSAGYWAVNPDGMNKRRLFNNYLESVDWSPDGQWIVYNNNDQIYKIHFLNNTFDTNSIIQLTSNRKNYNPSWSNDGELIIYTTVSYGDTFSGIWIMENNGTNKRKVATGISPAFSDSFNNLIFYVGWIDSTSGGIIKKDINTNNELLIYSDENYISDHPKSLKDSSYIYIINHNKINGLDINIWTIDIKKNIVKKITNETVDLTSNSPFSSDPPGNKIVYSFYNWNNWKLDNSTLWIVDLNTGLKNQLTFNVISQ